MIYLLGSQPAALIDKFECDMPSLSPNGRFLTFVALYPKHFAPEDQTSNFVMFYDLLKAPGENRHLPRTDFPLKDVPDRRIGVQLYPLSRPAINQRHAVRPTHTIYDFTWSPDSTKLIFMDEEAVTVSDDISASAANVADRGNPDLSSPIVRKTNAYLVLVTFQNGTAKALRTPAGNCPLNSGNRCGFDFQRAVFGKDDLTIVHHVSGPK